MAVSWSPKLFRDALDQIPDPVLVSDSAGTVRFANRQVPLLLGYSIEEVLGQDVEQLMPERFRRRHVAHRDRFAADGAVRQMGGGLPLAACRKDGSEIAVQISLGPVKNVEGTFVVVTIRDNTMYQQLSTELSRARDAAANAERTARKARDALAVTREANAARWASACYSLRQSLHTLFMLNGLLVSRKHLDEQTLTHARASQEEAIISLQGMLDSFAEPSDPDSPTLSEATQTPDETVARLIERLKRDASRQRETWARVLAARLDSTVLIAVCDRSMREAAAGLLRSAGYRVLTAKNVDEARGVARLHPEVGCVLTEQVLGASETGADVIGTLRSMLGAGLKALLLSDDPVTAPAIRFDPPHRTRIARLPVSAEELVSLLDELRQDEPPRIRPDS